jgi:nucleoid DNA-binding protein
MRYKGGKHNRLRGRKMKKGSSKNYQKRELVARVAVKLDDVPQYVVGRVVQATLDEIVAVLREGAQLELRRFGVFETCERKARTGRNPKKPSEAVEIPARRKVRFRPGLDLRDLG